MRRDARAARDAASVSMLPFMLSLGLVTAAVGVVLLQGATQTRVREDAGVDLAQLALAAADVVSGTAGEPRDWYDDPAAMRRLGLLDADAFATAHPDKLAAISRGDVVEAQLLSSLQLDGDELTVRVATRALAAPARPVLGGAVASVAHFDQVDPVLGDVINSASGESLGALRDDLPAFAGDVQDWSYRSAVHPSQGLGDVFADHPWSIEYGLVPRLYGIAATYANVNNLGIPSATAEDLAFDRYVQGSSIAHWHVVGEGMPVALPGAGAAQGNALSVAFRHEPAGGNGVGLWRTIAGHRSWAVIGPIDVTDADDLTLSFRHFLRFAAAATFTDKASLLTWDATDGPLTDPQWRQLASTPACAPGGIGWANADSDDTPTDRWETRTIDLCEALDTADGELWLAFYWNTYCTVPLTGAEAPCVSSVEREAAWFIDDISVAATMDDSSVVLLETDFEPAPSEHAVGLLVVGSGVDHALHLDAPDDDLVTRPIDDFVRAGGDVLALDPGAAGEWLASIGLEAIPATEEQAVLEDASATVVRYPNALPATNGSFTSTALAWSRSPAGPAGLPDESLAVVHGTDGAATVAVGRPYAGSGLVRALAYDVNDFGDEDLLAALLQNLVRAGHAPRTGGPGAGLEPDAGSDDTRAHVRRLVVARSAGPDARLVPVTVEVEVWRVEQG